MRTVTLQQLFGQNATQTAETLTIYKGDLPGLTASSDNGAEQLLVALLLQAHQHFEGIFTDEHNNPITDEHNNPITYDNKQLYEKLNVSFWKRQFISKDNRHYCRDTFIVDVFLTPPAEPNHSIELDKLS